ncbi:MAG: MBL fold metallo-hydrolase [Proteobacteria bacterium]|nr:MBL fold metallo-hydrolase [Pseudomonadota bacterium]
MYLQDSFEAISPARHMNGQLGHPDLIGHSEILETRFYTCGDNAWCFVGNGLSNQTFVRGPEGIIAIDSGECVEEMQAALAALREVTDLPVVACIYTHFHYVGGTRAILDEAGDATLPIYGHEGIAANLQRFGGEIGPRSARGLVHQFGVQLPASGEDGLINVGLGQFFRNPGHAPYTHGYVPANQTFSTPVSFTIAGLQVEMTPAPSDATDSITIWFPELNLCVNNLVWPALFNIFAIRGEEYRDPRILLEGFSHLESLPIEQLLGTHGPPVAGREEIAGIIADFSDSIRFMWDQTVRGINQGLTLDELTGAVQLPARFRRTYFTRQFYGLVEHHVRQIHAGLFGWFDEEPAKLFPLPPADRAARLIGGFGGKDTVRHQVDEALEALDFRWAIELSSWLVQAGDEPGDRNRLATALRGVARRTTSANIRNWLLTRALELDGKLDLSRHRTHRFSYHEVLAAEPGAYVPVLRVMLDPARARGLLHEVRWHFDTGETAGLRLRDQVAIPTDGTSADSLLRLGHDVWAQLLAQKITLGAALEQGRVTIEGDAAQVRRFFAAFDLESLRS